MQWLSNLFVWGMTLLGHFAIFAGLLPTIFVKFGRKLDYNPSFEWVSIIFSLFAMIPLMLIMKKSIRVVKENHNMVTLNELTGKFKNYTQGLIGCWFWETLVEEVPTQSDTVNFSGLIKTRDGELNMTDVVLAWQVDTKRVHIFRKQGKTPTERTANIEKRLKNWVLQLIESSTADKTTDEVIAQKGNFISNTIQTVIDAIGGMDEELGVKLSQNIGNIDLSPKVAAVLAGKKEHEHIMEIATSARKQNDGLSARDALLYSMSITGNGENAHLISGNGGGGNRTGGKNNRKGKGGDGGVHVIVDTDRD